VRDRPRERSILINKNASGSYYFNISPKIPSLFNKAMEGYIGQSVEKK
jgi:hypothetical protein